MRDFPADVICRHSLVKMLLRQGRLEEAESEIAMLRVMSPNGSYVRSLATMTTIVPEEIHVEMLGSSANGSVVVDVETNGHTEYEPTNGRANGHGSIWVQSEISAYLDRLSHQIPVLERFFAPLGGGGGDGSRSEMRRPDEIESEFERV